MTNQDVLMHTKVSAASVANAFLDLQEADQSEYPPIDQMKLYKLVYYAQAWWLASNDEPLFEEDLEAWPWGPVVRELYPTFKSAGSGAITNQRAAQVVKTGSGLFTYRRQVAPPPPQAVMDFLKQIWEIHKKFTGVALSNATHQPGEPWTIVKDLYGSLEKKPLIPVELIKDVFRSKLKTIPA